MGPKRSHSQPVNGMNTAIATVYAATASTTRESDAPNSSLIHSSGALMIVPPTVPADVVPSSAM